MLIMALDAARRTGFCIGHAGKIPESGSWVLRKAGDPNGLAVGELARRMIQLKEKYEKPDLIVCEHWLPPRASPDAHSVEDALRLNGAVNAVAGVWGVDVTEPYPATVRSQVCGKAHDKDSLGGTKMLVLQNMIMRKMVPVDCMDFDRADACALWVWAESNFARVNGQFVLTGK